ncbi:MAG: MutS-related protein [Acidimicrobiales bacterium]
MAAIRTDFTSFCSEGASPTFGWIKRISEAIRQPNTIDIADRDQAGAETLGELRARGINLAANTLAQSTEHVLAFFGLIRFELGFYIGCLNLLHQLAAIGEPTCIPRHLPVGNAAFACQGIYDPGLALRTGERAVGNDVDTGGKPLVIITGANHGGKSTFLRSAGIAQLMMQSGMFVPAASFTANVHDGLFVHFKREEDANMESGKFDEELMRMSRIADQARAGAMVLFNESFSSTNEREGSEISRQIVQALLEAGITVMFVTHFYEFTQAFSPQEAFFLRAERLDDGQHTFRLAEGRPLLTAYAEDLYQRIFSTGENTGQPPV